MPRPPRDALRLEILTVAERLFSRIGFRGTSLQAIADEVDCSKAALLYHFSTKAAILDALLEQFGGDIAALLATLSETDPAQRQARGIDLGVGLVVKHRAALAMLHGIEDLPDLSAVVAGAQESVDQLRAAVTGTGGSATDRAAGLVFEHGLIGACLSLTDLDDAALAQALREIGARIFRLDAAPPIPGPAAPPTPTSRSVS